MKLKLPVFAILLISVVLLSSCSIGSDVQASDFMTKSTVEIDRSNAVVLELKKDKYTKSVKQIEALIKNNTKDEISFGNEVILQYQCDDGWYTIDVGGYFFDYGRNLLAEGHEDVYIFPLYMLRGNDLIRNIKLKDGNYRVVLPINTSAQEINISSEFTIE